MKITSLLIIGVLFTQLLFSQSIEINDVKRKRFTGVETIQTGNSDEVSGYYTYYMKEKKSKGMRVFEFTLIDREVTKTIKTEVEIHKAATINSTVFNGQFFLLSYNDYKAKKIVLLTIDTQGKITTKKSIPLDKKKIQASTIYADQAGDGFYIVNSKKVKKMGYGYTLQKVTNELEKVWEKQDVPVKGYKAISNLINSKDRFVIWQEFSPKMFSKKIKPSIVCFDAKTGDKIFERDGYDGVSTILHNQIRISDDGSIYAGGAYVDGEKYKSVNNAGVYLLKLDADGKEVLYTKVNNKEKIQSVLKTTSKSGSLGSKDKVFVEDLILDGDNIIIISEMFKKNMNMTPKGIQQARDLITGKYIGWAQSSDDKAKVVMQIMDYILFKFNKDGKLVEIKPINKEDYNKITCWNPYASMNGMDLAKVLSQQGWFDYSFTEDDGNGKVMVCKNNASKQPEVFIYTLDDNYAQKKINLKQQSKIDLEKSKVGYFNVLRNKKGKIAVVYFQKKLKRITINLESLH